jgi:hypothetical protein
MRLLPWAALRRDREQDQLPLRLAKITVVGLLDVVKWSSFAVDTKDRFWGCRVKKNHFWDAVYKGQNVQVNM